MARGPCQRVQMSGKKSLSGHSAKQGSCARGRSPPHASLPGPREHCLTLAPSPHPLWPPDRGDRPHRRRDPRVRRPGARGRGGGLCFSGPGGLTTALGAHTRLTATATAQTLEEAVPAGHQVSGRRASVGASSSPGPHCTRGRRAPRTSSPGCAPASPGPRLSAATGLSARHPPGLPEPPGVAPLPRYLLVSHALTWGSEPPPPLSSLWPLEPLPPPLPPPSSVGLGTGARNSPLHVPQGPGGVTAPPWGPPSPAQLQSPASPRTEAGQGCSQGQGQGLQQTPGVGPRP